MPGYLSLILHAHLPFVRHPEHERFLEENWLFEAITETYLPLLQILQGWLRDGLNTQLALTLSPTLSSMLLDPLLQARYLRHLRGLIKLAEKEIERTRLEPRFNVLARGYHHRFLRAEAVWLACEQNLIAAFGRFQELGTLEIITSAATHSLLPLLADHPPSLRAQVLVARDHYRSCFGRDPVGIWLPECAYTPSVDAVLQEANIRWFVTDTHGLLNAEPRPRYGVFAPVFTPGGIAAFGRDLDSSKQVWSKTEGYPGDPRYREFYRDIGLDLDLDYLNPHLASPGHRGFTGMKYFRITGGDGEKQVYDEAAALQAAAGHARHFLNARVAQLDHLAGWMDRPPIVVAPYDAELFGHWWHEGPEFLDCLVRQSCLEQQTYSLISPGEFLRRQPTHQIAQPAASSWGEHGYWEVWLNESNAWIYPHLTVAQRRMTELAQRFPEPRGPLGRALRQAARELLLAQASDWPFILRSGTSPQYARRRVRAHVLRFTKLYDQIRRGAIDDQWLGRVEARDNLFPEINPAYWK